MVRMFDGDDSEEVIGLARELLPASMVASSVIAAVTGETSEGQMRLVVEVAGRLSRDMARNYLDEAALRRSSSPEIPPYGCRQSQNQKSSGNGGYPCKLK